MRSLALLRRYLLALAIALSALSLGAGPAFAGSQHGPGDPPKGQVRLERAYKQAQKNLERQGRNAAKAEEYAARVEKLITKLKEKGRNTASLEQALASFRSTIGTARKEWEGARDILKAHAGFDEQGKVTDANQAATTLKSVHERMQKVHETTKGAYRELKQAFKTFRKANRDVKEPPVPEEP